MRRVVPTGNLLFDCSALHLQHPLGRSAAKWDVASMRISISKSVARVPRWEMVDCFLRFLTAREQGSPSISGSCSWVIRMHMWSKYPLEGGVGSTLEKVWGGRTFWRELGVEQHLYHIDKSQRLEFGHRIRRRHGRLPLGACRHIQYGRKPMINPEPAGGILYHIQLLGWLWIPEDDLKSVAEGEGGPGHLNSPAATTTPSQRSGR